MAKLQLNLRKLSVPEKVAKEIRGLMSGTR